MIELELKVDGLTNRKFWKATGKDEDFRCFHCGKELLEGFMCENDRRFILCQDCQDDFSMSKCHHDKRNEHFHIKFTRGQEE